MIHMMIEPLNELSYVGELEIIRKINEIIDKLNSVDKRTEPLEYLEAVISGSHLVSWRYVESLSSNLSNE